MSHVVSRRELVRKFSEPMMAKYTMQNHNFETQITHLTQIWSMSRVNSIQIAISHDEKNDNEVKI